MRLLRRALSWARRRARTVLGRLRRPTARAEAGETPKPEAVPVSWPGSSVPSALQAILVEAAAPHSASDKAVAYVSHPFYGGPRRSEWQLDLFPNSAVAILEKTLPKALVIDASAGLGGSPWAGSGSEVDPRRSWALVELIRAAARAGIPRLFRWDVRGYLVPVLRRIASECDLAVSAEPGMTPEDLPLVPHGVRMRGVGDGGRRVAVFTTASPFGGSSHVPTLGRLGDWEAEVIQARLLHDPSVLAEALAACSVALFPPASRPGLVTLEALGLGLAVVGPLGPDLPNVHPSPPVVDDEFLGLMDVGRAEAAVETRWHLQEEHSTTAEARRIGRLTGISSLAEVAEDGGGA